MAYNIKTKTRTETGKGKIRKLRRNGTVPAVMYGHGDPSVLLSLDDREFTRLLQQIRGHSPIVDLEIDGKSAKCIIKTLQRNPIDGSLLHVDFQKVHPTEKVTVNVPVILHGDAQGIKEGGMLDHILREVTVRATIDKIPEHFDIDVAPLALGQSVHISDLKTEGIEFTLPLDSAIVTVLVPRKLAAAQAEAAAPAAEEVPAVEAEAGEKKEPEVITEKKKEKETKEEKSKKKKKK